MSGLDFLRDDELAAEWRKVAAQCDRQAAAAEAAGDPTEAQDARQAAIDLRDAAEHLERRRATTL